MAFAAYGVWPQSVGSKRMGVIVHAGPTTYAPVTTAPLAGGDTASPVDFALNSIENCDGGITSDGLYRVEPIMPTSGPVTRTGTITLRWTVIATGLQAGAINLSGSSVSLIAVGL